MHHHFILTAISLAKEVEVQMTFTNCFARQLNMLHEHTLAHVLRHVRTIVRMPGAFWSVDLDI